MERLFRVQETYDDGTALVRAVCSACHKCSGCLAVQKTALFRANNSFRAKPGELVTVTTISGPKHLETAVLHLLPLTLFFAGYFVGNVLWNSGAATGCLVFAAGIICVGICDWRSARKQNTVYTITGYPSREVLESQIKGDNDLD